MLGFGMIGFGGFGLRFLQGGICDSGFEVPFESFIMLDGGLGFRFFLGGSGGDNFGALELGAWMILKLGGTIGFTSLGSGFRVPSDSCTMLGFGMIGIGGFGLRSLQGGISASGFGVPFDSFTMLDGGFGFRSLFNSKTTYSTIDARYSTMWKKLFTLNSAWPAFDAYLHHSIFFTDAIYIISHDSTD